MRKFNSYGPVNSKHHYCVERKELITKCMEQLVGNQDEGGHYFTIWAPRQTGKTWLMKQVKNEIEKRYKDSFIIGAMSMQRLTMKENDSDKIFFEQSSRVLELCFNKTLQNIETWDQWIDIFSIDKGIFEKPIILFIDEFDKLPQHIIEQLVTLFRDIYLNRTWENLYEASFNKEWNNTILNLIKKAKGKYVNYVLDLFTKQNMPFSIWSEWCSYLYLNGIIDEDLVTDKFGKKTYVCRFASPFIQTCMYIALSEDLIEKKLSIFILDPLDNLADVFEKEELDLCALLKKYKDYLKRLKDNGLNPWKDQPRRNDLSLTEAVGHFHLYSWLKVAVDGYCVVSPEFPTGNGRVDLHLNCGSKHGIIEVKSFVTFPKLKEGKITAAKYAKQLGISSVSMAVFISKTNEEIINKLSIDEIIDEITIRVVMIEWV